MIDYKRIINEIALKYQDILKNNLVGIYLHGSIVLNSFNDNSDIDFIVIVNKSLSINEKISLINVLLSLNYQAPKKGYEMSVVLKEYAKNFVYPTPFEIHYSSFHLNEINKNIKEYCLKMHGTDEDIASYFRIIKITKVKVIGEDVDKVFGDVKEEYYYDSIIKDIPYALDKAKTDPTYMILNLARTICYKEEKKYLSKADGGMWLINNSDGKYNDLIQKAINKYLKNINYTFIDEEIDLFYQDMMKRLKIE